MALGRELGPLEGLQGTWEGAEGLDVAYSNERGAVADTHFRERTTFDPFGPVDLGRQVLYGLDYRTAAWRGTEESPFHTEVGYWLWDAGEGQVMRCFVVPRGSMVLAGGWSEPDADILHMEAEAGSETYGILSSRCLAEQARTVRYEVTVAVGDGAFSYEETSTIVHGCLGEVLEHTDRNTLRLLEGPGD